MKYKIIGQMIGKMINHFAIDKLIYPLLSIQSVCSVVNNNTV
jgi:hypothetical protein